MPLVKVDPASDNWRQGTRVIEEQGKAMTRQARKLKWRRIWSSLITTLITIAAAYVMLASGFIGIERERPSSTPTPTPNAVYKISGQVVDQKRISLSGINITLTGGATNLTATTDSAGNYAFDDLQGGSSYTITPQASQRVAFTPPSRSINKLSRDESADFSGIVDAELYKISGRVTDQNRRSLNGINITLTGVATSLTTTTDSAGSYAFDHLLAGGSYTIAPHPSQKITFTLPSRSINKLSRNESADFSGVVKPELYKISGRATDQDRRSLSGINITLKGGAKSLSMSTDSGGNYAFNDLLADRNYTVTPRSSQKMTFTPPSRSINKLSRDESADFSGVVKPDLYKISGRVTDQNKRALSGINLALKGEAKSLSMSTDSEGNYAFDQLPAGGSYTITPQPSQKITFTPPGRSINNLRKDASADFTGVVQVDEVYKISGRVTNNGKPLGGIHIRIGGARATSTDTDSHGYYSFGGLRAGGDYTIMPVDEKANFTPPSRSIDNLRKDESADFSGVVQIDELYKISGRVTNNGKPLGGVTIRLGGAKTASIETDTNGYYSFSDLQAGGSYTIKPASGNTNFTPPGRSISNLRNDESADFSGLLQVDEFYKISGRVTNSGKPIAGVNMTIDEGAKTSSVTTDGNGHYTFSELRAGGSYVITPASGRTDFTPRSRSIKNLRKDRSADFSTIVPCTEDDRARAREALLNKYAATWQSSIESEKPRVIAATVAENLPGGVEPRAVEATATLGPVRYDVTFLGCSPLLVTARYEWQVRMFFNGKTKVVAVPRHKTCGKVVGMGLCR